MSVQRSCYRRTPRQSLLFYVDSSLSGNFTDRIDEAGMLYISNKLLNVDNRDGHSEKHRSYPCQSAYGCATAEKIFWQRPLLFNKN